MPNAGQKILAVNHHIVAAEVNDDEENFTNTSYSVGSVPCGVAFVAPPSGRVLILWYAYYETNATSSVFISASVREGSTVGSGSPHASATDTRSLTSQSTGDDRAGIAMRVVSGLTAGSTYNATIEFRVTGNSGDILNRVIAVIPMP